jgi:methionine-rich copper-binding protein CopC
MKLAYIVSVWLLAVGTTCAHAHAHLQQATPADGSVVTSAPASLVLRFSEDARLTALWISRDGGSRQKLAPPQESQTTIVVALPPLAPGRYLVSWRALGADGHVLPGQIRFTLTR